MDRGDETRRGGGRPLRLIVWGFLAFLLPAAPLHAEDAVFPQGSHVGLVPPQGMELSSDFAGFINPDNGASILIAALPSVAYDEMIAGLTAEALANKGMTLTGTCDAAKPAFESACFRDTQQDMGQQYHKWLLIVRLPNEDRKSTRLNSSH